MIERDSSGNELMHATTRRGLRARLSPAFERALAVRLFYKILVANAVILVVGAGAASLVTATFVRAAPGRPYLGLIAMLALAGVLATVLVNALILRLALRPLRRLEFAAMRVQAGDLDARVEASALADRDLARLIVTFNGMLDSMSAYRQRLREVAARALDAAEEERKRVARELHDETAQTLAALLIRLRLARSNRDAQARDALLEEVRGEIAQAMEGIRRIARGLRPPALDVLGLSPAIESHARMLAAASGLEVDVAAERADGLLSPEAELAMYRVVQEALSNVVRHAGAKRARIRVWRAGRHVVAAVEDDGRGFDSGAPVNGDGRGLGLFGMQERAAYVGGRVSIESEPGKGTRVRVEIPIAEARAYA